MNVSWYLADLGEARGKQELFTRQSLQRLKVLREHALIESAVSSNRIEGIEIDQSRIGTVIFGRPTLRDRNEEEVRGYPRPRPVARSYPGICEGLRFSESICSMRLAVMQCNKHRRVYYGLEVTVCDLQRKGDA
jgi:hypothetical protein